MLVVHRKSANSCRVDQCTQLVYGERLILIEFRMGCVAQGSEFPLVARMVVERKARQRNAFPEPTKKPPDGSFVCVSYLLLQANFHALTFSRTIGTSGDFG